MSASPRLLDLLGRDELDWDNPKHREAYLRAWVNGELRQRPEEEEPDDR